MKFHSVFSLVVCTVSLLALVALPAGAVTWATANGATSGTITTPGWVVFRCNTSAAGAWVRFVAGPDLNGNGHLDAAEPVVACFRSVTDGGWMDEDPASAAIKVSEYFSGFVSGALVLQAVDQDGSTVGHVYSFNYTHPGQSISGTVLYDNGAPAASLFVWTWGQEESASTACFTDASGRYTLYLPAGKNAIGVSSNTEGGGLRCVPMLRWVDLASGAAVTGVNLTMLRGSGPQIIGAVTEGDTSRPVPGVVLTAEEISSGAEVTGFTNIDGDYALNVSSGTWRVHSDTRWQSAGPYADPAAEEVVVSSANVTVNIALTHLTGRIYGTVTGPGGIVAPGSGATAYPSVGDGKSFGCAGNGQGHYEIWLAAGSYQAHPFDDEGNYIWLAASAVNFTIPPSHSVNFSLVAQPYTFSGRVVFEGTTTGVPYADLWADDTSGLYPDNVFYTTADPAGYFSTKMPAGTFNGYVESWLYESSAGPEALSFPPSLSNVTIPLAKNHNEPTLSAWSVSPSGGGTGSALYTFTATYTSADNTPPADVYGVIDSWPRLMAPTNPGDTNYSDGATFQVQRRLTSGAHNFWFGALDENMLQARLPAASNLSITVPANGILGQVKDKDTGQPVTGVTVSATSGAVLRGTGTTATNGIYSIPGVPSGTYTVTAAKDGYLTFTKNNIAFTAGQLTIVHFFQFEKAGKITGGVKDKDTALAVAGVTVQAIQGSVVKGQTTTAADGTYTIAGLPAGTYTVAAGKAGYLTASKPNIPVVKGQTTTVNFFQFEKAGKIAGGVKDKDTALPVAGVTVQAIQAAVVKGSAASAADGSYTIAGLAAGTYTVTASKTGYVTLTKTGIAVPKGVTTTVNFYLFDKSGKITGGVKDDSTTLPVSGATVRAYLGGTQLKASATTAADGTYTISRDLPAGTYSVTASKTGYITLTKTGIAVPKGVTTTVNFYHLVPA